MNNSEQKNRSALDTALGAAFAAININPPFLIIEQPKAKQLYRAYRKLHAKRNIKVG